MFLLDTDTVNLILRGQPQVVNHVVHTPPERIWTSTVTLEEIIVYGRFSFINDQYDPRRRTVGLRRACNLLTQTLIELQPFNVWPNDDDAHTLYKSWPAKVVRVGASDCKIAAIGIVNNLTVVTRNTQDFELIRQHDKRLKYEDWSV